MQQKAPLSCAKRGRVMGNHNHDTLWLVFHKTSRLEPFRQFSPQYVGNRPGVEMICGGFARIGGEQRICNAGSNLSFNGLGDGDHSSGLSLLPRGFLIGTKTRGHRSVLGNGNGVAVASPRSYKSVRYRNGFLEIDTIANQ